MDHGLLIWTFILIGNAAAVFVLSVMTSGGTSTMGAGGQRDLHPRT